MPVATVTPSPSSALLNSSYSRAACSGGAAEMKLGRRCPRASPYKVNCETTRAAPFTSSSDRFIFPCSSAKMRRFATFSASEAATAGESSRPTPSSTINPAPISPVTRPSTVTLARLTRCTTARISLKCCRSTRYKQGPSSWAHATCPERSEEYGRAKDLNRLCLAGCTYLLIGFFLFHRLPRQQLRQLRDVVRKHRQHLRTFGQVIPTHVLQPVRLGVVHFVVVGDVLHAPKSRHARFIKWHVVGAALLAQARLH